MRLTILAKLILTIALPLVIIFLIVLPVNMKFLRDAATQEMQERIGVIVQQVASRMSEQFARLAQIAHSTARNLGTGRLDDVDLFEIVQSNVEDDPQIYGSCIAFARDRAPGRAGLFAPYAHRTADGGIAKLDVTDAYDYTNDTWEWFRVPRDTGLEHWTEPFFDQGAGNILMSTYTAPFSDSEGQFRGVATVDISLDALSERIKSESDSANTGIIVLSRTGAILASANLGTIEHSNIMELCEQLQRTEVTQVAEEMMRGESGVRIVQDFPASGPHFIAFAPIPSNGWSLAVTVSEAEVLAPANARIRERAVSMVILLMVIVAGILAISFWLTRPIKRLSVAVAQLATGNLDARAEGIRSRDEIGELALAFNSMAGQLREKIEQLAKEMAERAMIDADLTVARQIQSSLLPQKLGYASGSDRVAIHALNLPARQVAGDFYDYLWVDSQRLLLVIADVSGKGIPAAMFMAITRTLLRSMANLGMTPGELVRRLNETLLLQNDAGMFVTLIAGYYDAATRELTYCNAGHPTPFRISRDGTVSRVGSVTGTVVGAIDDTDFAEDSIHLEPGDRLVFFTDGIPEARAPDGTFYTDEGFEQLLREVGRLPLTELGTEIADRMDRFQAGVLKDDVTIVMLDARQR